MARAWFRGTTPHRLLLLLTALFLASAASALQAGQDAKPAGRTVWDGAYTEAQAERGTQMFSASCGNCHSLSPSGNRSLTTPAFLTRYTQRSVGDLLTFVTTNMPNGSGNSLSPSTYSDIVAFLLKSNGLPPGSTELAAATAAEVQIVPKDGSGELPAGALVRVVGCLARSGSDWVLTSATAPERVEKAAASAADAAQALGDRTTTLKFVLTRLDNFVGNRMAATGLLIGPGGRDGLNVTAVSRVADTCP
jgi:mono/diheme cytochrome c family protein